MATLTNTSGQPIGFPVPDWQACSPPPRTPLQGRYCRLEILDPAKHAEDLYAAFATDTDQQNWTYLAYGPFNDFASFQGWLTKQAQGSDPLFHAILDAQSGKAVGVASYLRIEPAVGVIEIGHIHYSPLLQRTPMSTETMYLLMKRAFDELGYRRYEWKCDALNAPSKQTARRLGFEFEGIFRQALVYKGRNRDTAWFSILDSEWPMIKAGFERWLDPANFDANGQQLARLQTRV